MARKRTPHPRRRKTDDCSTPILPGDAAGADRKAPEPPSDDVVDRLISRRHLVIDAGDVFITKIAVLWSGNPDRYRVAHDQDGPALGEYCSYDEAVKAGDAVATSESVRLYYREGLEVVPQLLKDCRKN